MKQLFSRILGNARKQKRRDEQRERDCMVAIGVVLKAHSCTLVPVIKADERSIYADVLVEALPETKNESRHNATTPTGPGASAATEGSTDGQIRPQAIQESPSS